MAPDPSRTLYINDIAISTFLISSGVTYTITNTGITLSNNTSWTYSGSGTFLGFSTTEGDTIPLSDLEVGDTGLFGSSHIGIDSNYHWYSVASAPVINPLDATDLTNTTWYLKQHVNVPPSSSYYITFSSGSYDCIIFGGSTIEYGDTSQQSSDLVYQTFEPPYGWGSNNSRTLTITGGTDVTNSTLIAWLKANCVSPLEYITCTNELTDLADAIRAKTSTSSQLTYPSGYVSAINGISVKHVTSYSAGLSGPNDVYIEIGDIPGNWNGFSSISVEIEPNIYDGSVTIYTPPSLISFTAYDGNLGRTYSLEAEDGMTWSQWISSEYNSDGFSSQGTAVLYPSHESAVTTSNGGSVTTASTIIENHAYNYTLW